MFVPFILSLSDIFQKQLMIFSRLFSKQSDSLSSVLLSAFLQRYIFRPRLNDLSSTADRVLNADVC